MTFRRLLLTFSLFASIFAEECDPNLCQNPLKRFYEELGCSPVIENCCPSRYECPNFASMDPLKCHYKGRSFEAEEELLNTRKLCQDSCHCDSINSRMEFVCASVDCPEYFSPRLDNVVYLHNDSECCAIDQLTDKQVIKSLPICEYGGRKYVVGQRIYPKDTCQVCHCHEAAGMSGEEPQVHCVEEECGLELKHFKKLKDKCAPIYVEGLNCCPVDWLCLDQISIRETLEVSENVTVLPSSLCQLGDDQFYPQGAQRTLKDFIHCSCDVPPFLKCVRKFF